MKCWAVTGGAGTGKSALCRFLAARGAAVVNGDLLGHEILARPSIAAAIEGAFGPGVMAAGAVDRSALGAVVFADPEALATLNGITHGPLADLADRRLGELASAGGHRLAVLEAAVYFLLPRIPRIDLVIAVRAELPLRIARLTAAGDLTVRQARARIDAQRYLEKGWAGADVVLVNDGALADLAAAADALWDRLED